MRLISQLQVLRHKESVQDLFEYALLVGIISLVTVVIIRTSGGSVNMIFANLQTMLAARV